MSDYQEFLRRKERRHVNTGLTTIPELHPALFPWQREIVAWALRKGRACMFEDCGLGKTFQQLEWARHVPGDVILFTPLAVSYQTQAEAERFGIDAKVSRDGKRTAKITITNYEQMHRFNLDEYQGIVLDECFAAGTPIDTPTGPKHIETIRPGDTIVNAYGVDSVSSVHRREVFYAVKVTIGASSYIASPNHPFFTQRGWVEAQDLRAGDYALDTKEAMRLVRGEICPKGSGAICAEVLRDILLSEMANDAAGDFGKSTFTGSGCQAGAKPSGVVEIRRSESSGRSGTSTENESINMARNSGENIPHIESDASPTFRAWRERYWFDDTSVCLDGCIVRELESGICYITGPKDSRLSEQLQSGLGERRKENRNRGGWVLPLLKEETGQEEGRKTGFVRVDGAEILEQGNTELERSRSADGKLYFYDLGASRHPSYSVNGFLVHNSSIIKSHDGKTRTAILDAAQSIPFRLACTATPAPNDHIELGNHAEFVGAMTRPEMLATFFVHDGGDTASWRLKGHAVKSFWEWVATWAVMVRMPSDLGYPDDDFVLPPINIIEHRIESGIIPDGELFAQSALTLGDQRKARRKTLSMRVEKAREIIESSDGPWIAWCELNDEGDELTHVIEGAVQIAGKNSDDEKSERMVQFVRGEIDTLVSKPRIMGFGMNLQICHKMLFVGLSNSWEQFYQATRRCWRFGQTEPVDVHIVATDVESAVLDNIKRKQLAADEMGREMVENMRTVMNEEIRGTKRTEVKYERDRKIGEGWMMHLGDSVEVIAEMESESIDYSIFSPPFASLYTYSASDKDMGNCTSHADFFEHFAFLIPELLRVTKPGRLLSFHCMNLPLVKERDGVIGLTDFRGKLIELFVRSGWIYHSEVVIWKDPVTAMQRTKALGLLHKQLKKDSCMSRQGIPDYLVTMRKPGDNPERVTKTNESFPVRRWQEYASPVWMNINQSDTLQFRSAREDDDERHVCPLQLEVIRRCVELWTNPGDLILSPFAGIGSEGYVAIEMDRRFVGMELKRSYYKQACENLRRAKKQVGLFDVLTEMPEEATP